MNPRYVQTLARVGLATLLFCHLAIETVRAEEFRPDVSPMTSQQTIDLIIGQMAKKQEEAQTIRAQFTMEKKTSLLASPARAEGVLCITKPDKVYWEVKDPIANTLILCRDTLWMHYPTLRQVDKVDISGKRGSVMRYLTMSEEGSAFKENFRIRLLSGPGEKGPFLLELLPKTPRTSKRFEKMKIWVDPQSWMPVRLDLWEPGNDYSSIKLKNVKVNGPIPNSIYEFKPPPGTVVNEPLKTSPPRSQR